MASPTIDGSVAGHNLSVSSGTLTLSTTKANDVICLAVTIDETSGTAPSITSVTSTSSLVWTLRASSNTTPSVNGGITLYYYTAPSIAILTNEVITFSFSVTIDEYSAVAFGVNGCNSINLPFDPNVSLPVTVQTAAGTTNFTQTVTGISTTNNDDLLIFLAAYDGNPAGSQGLPSGFTVIQTQQNNNGINDDGINTGYLSLSSPLSNQSYTTQAMNMYKGYGTAIVDVFTADAPVVAAVFTPIPYDQTPSRPRVDKQPEPIRSASWMFQSVNPSSIVLPPPSWWPEGFRPKVDKIPEPIRSASWMVQSVNPSSVVLPPLWRQYEGYRPKVDLLPEPIRSASWMVQSANLKAHVISIRQTNSAAQNFYLPPIAATTPGEIYVFKDSNGVAFTYNYTIKTGDGATIDGAATYVLNTNKSAVAIMYDGNEWMVVWKI